MIWMNSRVRPPLARRTVRTSSARPGMNRSSPDPEQRAARNVPDAGRLDHQRARLPAREALVPRQDLRRDQPVVGGPPGHHGRNPGALRQLEPPGAERAEPEHPGRLRGGGWVRRRDRVLDEGLGCHMGSGTRLDRRDERVEGPAAMHSAEHAGSKPTEVRADEPPSLRMWRPKAFTAAEAGPLHGPRRRRAHPAPAPR